MLAHLILIFSRLEQMDSVHYNGLMTSSSINFIRLQIYLPTETIELQRTFFNYLRRQEVW